MRLLSYLYEHGSGTQRINMTVDFGRMVRLAWQGYADLMAAARRATSI